MVAMGLLVSSSNGLSAKADVDVNHYRVKIPNTKAEFVPCSPNEVDHKSVERGWRYVLRYIHNDSSKEGLSFLLMLVHPQKSGEFILALHEAKNPNVGRLDDATDEEKIKLADATRVIDQSLAQALYEAWVNALVRARLPDDIGSSTSSEYYYLSIFSVDTGYMSAVSGGFQKDKTTGKIREIGLLLKSYLEEADPSKSKRIEGKIREAIKLL